MFHLDAFFKSIKTVRKCIQGENGSNRLRVYFCFIANILKHHRERKAVSFVLDNKVQSFSKLSPSFLVLYRIRMNFLSHK